jgi:hypothetical protein
VADVEGARFADFTQLDLKLHMIEHLAGFFKGRTVNGHPMARKILPGFPNSPQQLPCLTVRVVGDTTEGGAVGLDFGYQREDTGEWFESKGSYWRESLEIRYFAESSELRDIVRPWVRAALFDSFEVFDAKGAQLPQVSGGQDEEDFSEQAPQELFMVSYQVSFKVFIVKTHVWYEKAEGVDVSIGFENEAGVDLALAERIKRLMGAQK